MKPRGFIALMSALLLSGVLLAVAASGSLVGFYTRAGIAASELKERSTAAADACADQALIALIFDDTYAGNETVVLNTLDQCRVGALTDTPTTKVFSVQATSSGKAVTTLRIVYATTTKTVVSWLEVLQ